MLRLLILALMLKRVCRAREEDRCLAKYALDPEHLRQQGPGSYAVYPRVLLLAGGHPEKEAEGQVQRRPTEDGSVAGSVSALPGAWGWATWLLLTSACIALSTVASLALPFFSLVMALISATGDFMSLVGLPCLFSLCLMRLPSWEKVVCVVLVAVAVVASGLGLWSCVAQLMAAATGSG